MRGGGLIAAVELVKQKQPRTPFELSEGVGAYCAAACHDAGVILRNLGDSVAFCPPLVITEDQIDELISKFANWLGRDTRVGEQEPFDLRPSTIWKPTGSTGSRMTIDGKNFG